MRAAPVLALLILAQPILAACAGASGDVAEAPLWRGRALATQRCAGCHAVDRDGRSLLAGAPAFRSLDLPDGAALRAFAGDLRRHHPDGMPEILLTDAEAGDLYRYMQSLRSDAPAQMLPPAPSCFLRRC